MKKTIFFTSIIVLVVSVASKQPGSHFVGTVVAQWLGKQGDYRQMKLVQKFGYIDSNGKAWNVPSNAVVDGASIPRILWSIVGSPYTGAYREASVVHDWYCVTKNEPWYDVHRMFYNACITNGLNEIQAKMMYAAVYSFGPRWEKKILGGCPTCYSVSVMKMIRPDYPESTFENDKKWIEDNNPSLKEIETRLSPSIKEKVVQTNNIYDINPGDWADIYSRP